MSPYLLHHVDNPVDWWLWGDDAFAEARRRDVPVFLSIGYSACHWCHVMADESFSDDRTAAVLNDHFVSIKVDREELPDVDAIYMAATQGLSGQGGWPMSVFLTHARQPFFAGTYFPPVARHGLPAFGAVLTGVIDAWEQRRDDVDHGAERIAEALQSRHDWALSSAGAAALSGLDELTVAAVAALSADFDVVNGGFGGAPKFPTVPALEFLLAHSIRTGDRQALAMVERVCVAMADGGLNDQLDGGFSRYSVDAGWVVPHFEKMLYDNACLLRLYARLHSVIGSAGYRRVAERTADFLIRRLALRSGGFAASLDADAQTTDAGLREGACYVWSREEIIDVLGPDAPAAMRILGLDQPPNFEGDTWVLRIAESIDEVAADAGVSNPASWWDDVRARLLAARDVRPQPFRDDKVVTAWNALTISALSVAGRVMDRPDWIDAATRCADYLLAVHVVGTADGLELARTSRNEAVGAPGVLEDYGSLACALIDLYTVTANSQYLDAAASLGQMIIRAFYDPDQGFCDTSRFASAPVIRNYDPYEHATPSGWSESTSALLSLSNLLSVAPYREIAEQALTVLQQIGPAPARHIGGLLTVAEAYLDGPFEVVVVGDELQTRELVRTAVAQNRPGALILAGGLGRSDGPFADRGGTDGEVTAYVCRGMTCFAPSSDAQQVQALLRPGD